MSDDLRVYRIGSGKMVGLSVFLLVAGAAFTGLIALGDDVPGFVAFCVGAGWLLFMGWLLGYLWRSATAVTTDGVLVHHLRRSTLYRWPDIADLRIGQHQSERARDGAYDGIILFDTAGHRILLPYVNERALPGHSLARELELFRSRWLERRGEDWQDRTPDVERVVERIATRQSVWLIASVALLGSWLLMMLLMVVVIVLSANDVLTVDFPAELTFIPLFGVPLLVFAVTAAVGLVRRRRR